MWHPLISGLYFNVSSI